MEGISKAFAGIKALDNVQIDLRQGEIHALMGENGAGKSTLMKIMTGVYSRDSGKMYLQNTSSQQLEEVEIKSPLAAQKLGLSMVFQEFNLLENMNIAENIFIGREPLEPGRTVDKKQLLQNAVTELKKVNLNGKCCEVDVSEGEILEITSNGNLSRSTFTMQDYIHTIFNLYNWNYLNYAKWWEADEQEELLLEYCGTFGVSEEEVELLLEVGYDPDEIEELLMDTAAMEEAISEAKTLLQCEA